jgi:hypothetical protein
MILKEIMNLFRFGRFEEYLFSSGIKITPRFAFFQLIVLWMKVLEGTFTNIYSRPDPVEI